MTFPNNFHSISRTVVTLTRKGNTENRKLTLQTFSAITRLFKKDSVGLLCLRYITLF